MTPSAIEAWVLRVVDQVTRGQHSEDSRVELKREWPKPATAARLIAGHANAARGASILWIIGLDESTGVQGAPKEELANWYNSVKQFFDGIAPDPYDLNVPVGEKTLVALHFETDRAPYVVRNSVYGLPGGGSVEREVPWREGRSTLSARREHLLRLLVPTTDLPDVEVLSCDVSAWAEQLADKTEIEKWSLRGTLYLSPRRNEVVIPFHRAKLTILQGQEKCIGPWTNFRMFPPSHFDMLWGKHGSRVDSETVSATSSEVILSGPGKVYFSAETKFPFTSVSPEAILELRLVLCIVGAATPLSFAVLMTPAAPDKHIQMAWTQIEEEDLSV